MTTRAYGEGPPVRCIRAALVLILVLLGACDPNLSRDYDMSVENDTDEDLLLMFVDPGAGWSGNEEASDEIVEPGSDVGLHFSDADTETKEGEDCLERDLLAARVSETPQVVDRLSAPICEGFVWEIGP